MSGCDFFVIISAVSILSVLLFVELRDKKSAFEKCNSKLFWCKKCGEFYLNKQDIEISECPVCEEKNTKLTF